MPFDWPDQQRLALTMLVHLDAPEPVPGSTDSVGGYAINAGFSRLARLLDEYAVPATWCCTAPVLEQFPQVNEYLRRRQHEICARGNARSPGLAWSADDERASVAQVAQRIGACTGVRPQGWYAETDGSADTPTWLIEHGFRYHLNDDSDDLPHWQGDLVAVPIASDSSDLNFLHTPGLAPDQWLQYVIDTLDVLHAEGELGARMMSLQLHPGVIGRPGRIHALEQFVQYATSKADVWIATTGQIAEHFARVTSAPDESGDG